MRRSAKIDFAPNTRGEEEEGERKKKIHHATSCYDSIVDS